MSRRCAFLRSAFLIFFVLGPTTTFGGTFQNPLTFPTGDGPWALAVGDFNNDGRPDIATADLLASPGMVSVLLGNSDGTFQKNKDFAAGALPYAIAVGDFNRDGNADLVVANECYSPGCASGQQGDVAILLGNGDGTFRPYQTYLSGDVTRSIAVADFNHDGNLDIITGNWGSLSVSVLEGNGDGTFQPRVDYVLNYTVQSVTAGDLNGDGHPDIVACMGEGSLKGLNIAILLNNGDGTFQPAVYYAATTGQYSGSYAAAIADVNHDGKQDLVVANDGGVIARSYNSVSVLLGNGDGTFRPYRTFHSLMYAHSVALGDFNNDGTQDVVLGDFPYAGVSYIGVGVILGKNNGTLEPGNQFASAGDPVAMVTADFNGDGAVDIAAANYTVPPQVSILLNGGGTFMQTTSSANPSKAGQPVTFTATVSATVGSGRSPGGRVVFKDGATTLGSAVLANGQASLTTSSLGVGSHTISVGYSGSHAFNRNQAAPITQQVDP